MPKVIDTFSQACDYWDAGQLHAAFRLFLRGAKEGDPSAQLNLAYFYGEGLSIRKNRNKELYWLRKAAKQEYASAARNIRPLAKVMDTATTDYKDQRSGSASI